jgi:hypothetical protein
MIARVVLTTALDRIAKMEIPELFLRIQQLGMSAIHFPVHDKWIPKEMSGLIELVQKLLERVDAGQRIVIHCNGGKGRTGLLVCAILVAKGLLPDDAIQAVRSRRKGMIRNPAQIFYLSMFEGRWRVLFEAAAKVPSTQPNSHSTQVNSLYLSSTRPAL